jgi:GNAT superfamily N-acetyltransferase
MADGVSRMSQLASIGEIIVAEHDGQIIGGVAYVPGGRPKAAYFDQSWPIIRMLVVAPDARGKGIGRRLTEECISRARRDKAPQIALHTTKIMSVAQPMYVRMGFELIRDTPPIYGSHMRSTPSHCDRSRLPLCIKADIDGRVRHVS